MGLITIAEYRAQEAAAMSEDQLQDKVEGLCRELGWLAYHTHNSRRSQKGFPDLVMVRGSRVVWRELKTMTGKPTPEQRVWLAALAATGADVGLWRPIDLLNETILHELTRKERTTS